MRLLLDTHILLWWLANNRKLSARGREAIAAADHLVFVSAASGWEIAIKKAIGKLSAPDDLLGVLEENQFIELPVRLAHTAQVEILPAIHQDPFDRLLVAQAMQENLVLMTHDPQLARYPVETLLV